METKDLEELVLDLINTLDSNEYIDKFKLLKKDLYSNKELNTLINEYQNTLDYNDKINAKKRLYDNKLFKNIKECEIEINYIMMEINKVLGTLTSEKSCH